MSPILISNFKSKSTSHYAIAKYRLEHRGKMHCARALFLLPVDAPLVPPPLKTIDNKSKRGFRPRILKNLNSRQQT